MFRKIFTAVIALIVGATLVATPAHAKPVKPRPGEGIYSMTARTCGTAATWRQQAAHNRITASSGYLVILGRTYDIDCPGAASRNAPRPVKASGKWTHPFANGKRANSPGLCWGAPRYDRNGNWDHSHQGVDLTVASGTPIRAMRAGRVVKAGLRGRFGYAVEIYHGNGISTLYAHASKIVTWSGTVRRGQTIALVGSTGASSGPHLHLQVHRYGAPINPAPFLRRHGVQVGC